MVDRLLANNQRWAQRKRAADPGFFERLSAGQAPEFLWIGCADSRVPASEILGLDPGELFVHRNVANIVQATDPNAMAVLQYAVEALHVRHIIICGHYGCGGVEAALKGGIAGMAGRWLEPLQAVIRDHAARIENRDGDICDPHAPPAAAQLDARLNVLCELNVAAQVKNVAETPVVRDAWSRGADLAIHGWIYDLRNGLLRDLKISRP